MNLEPERSARVQLGIKGFGIQATLNIHLNRIGGRLAEHITYIAPSLHHPRPSRFLRLEK